jgi:hypothetical protein
MTAQEHIVACGRALIATEAAIAAMEKALAQTKKSHAVLHARMERMQRDYLASRDGDNIVAFSGGNDKPPVNDPDEPVKP